MNEQDARAVVHAAIGKVAPDVDLADVDEGSRLRQDLELDSLDFLRLVEIIDTDTGVNIPERDYPAVVTVAGLIGYLASHG
ncbi:acyl carrier protein [Arthrobacter silvisoli]|uniref:acyl carrier protein n=1 Tax=Arthrobacter silvisoli TaxID=2291022 RepID=UPI000E20F61F|nr:acyl carrier protein [Arthrobacter silvisoli]